MIIENGAEAIGTWRKSSHSNANGNQCIEVAYGADMYADTAVIGVRDSKNPCGPILAIPLLSWTDFISIIVEW